MKTLSLKCGKDAIVVDENIDTDMAAEAIVTSAFGFSGQKCSACSRAIVHKDVYDEVLEKSIKLTKELTLGNTVNTIRIWAQLLIKTI